MYDVVYIHLCIVLRIVNIDITYPKKEGIKGSYCSPGRKDLSIRIQECLEAVAHS